MVKILTRLDKRWSWEHRGRLCPLLEFKLEKLALPHPWSALFDGNDHSRFRGLRQSEVTEALYPKILGQNCIVTQAHKQLEKMFYHNTQDTITKKGPPAMNNFVHYLCLCCIDWKFHSERFLPDDF